MIEVLEKISLRDLAKDYDLYIKEKDGDITIEYMSPNFCKVRYETGVSKLSPNDFIAINGERSLEISFVKNNIIEQVLEIKSKNESHRFYDLVGPAKKMENQPHNPEDIKDYVLLISENANLQCKNQALINQLKAAKRRYHNLHDLYNRLLDENEELQEKVGSDQITSSYCKTSLQTAQEMLKKKEEQIKILTNRNKNQLKMIESRDRSIAKLNITVSNLQSRNQELSNTINKLRKEADNKEESDIDYKEIMEKVTKDVADALGVAGETLKDLINGNLKK